MNSTVGGGELYAAPAVNGLQHLQAGTIGHTGYGSVEEARARSLSALPLVETRALVGSVGSTVLISLRYCGGIHSPQSHCR